MRPETHAERRARIAEEDALNFECNRLFPLAGFLNPAVSIEAAFILCNRIAQITDEHPALETKIGMINLCQTGTHYSPDGNNWAASFDIDCTDHPEWYESRNPGNLRYFARARTPQLAIARAAAKCGPLLLPLIKGEL